jgi:hypothetical protein
MRHEQFVALVRERGEYESPTEAEDLAAQLSPSIDEAMRDRAGEQAS